MQSPAPTPPLLPGESILWSGSSPRRWNIPYLPLIGGAVGCFAYSFYQHGLPQTLREIIGDFSPFLGGSAWLLWQARPSQNQQFYTITTNRALIQTRQHTFTLLPQSIASASLDPKSNSIHFPNRLTFHSLPDAPQVLQLLQSRSSPHAPFLISSHPTSPEDIWSRLEVGEQILWSGRPRHNPYLNSQGAQNRNLGLILLAIVAAIFLIVFPFQVVLFLLRQPLFLAIFIGLPLLFIWLPYQAHSYTTRRQLHASYAITDRRLITLNSFQPGEVSIPLASLTAIRADHEIFPSLAFFTNSTHHPVLLFENLHDPETPHQLILSRMLR